MKKYAVIDKQGGNFMADTIDEPMTLNALRARFWGLEDCRTNTYKQFTADYIKEAWAVEFIEEIEIDKWLYPEDLGVDLVINLFNHEGDNQVYINTYDLPLNWRNIVTKNNGGDKKPSIHDIMICRG